MSISEEARTKINNVHIYSADKRTKEEFTNDEPLTIEIEYDIEITEK